MEVRGQSNASAILERHKTSGMDPQKETTVHNAEHILICLCKVPNQKHGYRKCNCPMVVTVSWNGYNACTRNCL